MRRTDDRRADFSRMAPSRQMRLLAVPWQRFWRLRAFGRTHLAQVWLKPTGCPSPALPEHLS